MPNTKQKLSFYIQPHDCEYSVDGPGQLCVKDQDLHVWSFDHDMKTTSTIKISMLTKPSEISHCRIQRIELGGLELHNWDLFGTYRHSGRVHRTYGYMDTPGVYQFRIRFSASLHDHVIYFMTDPN